MYLDVTDKSEIYTEIEILKRSITGWTRQIRSQAYESIKSMDPLHIYLRVFLPLYNLVFFFLLFLHYLLPALRISVLYD